MSVTLKNLSIPTGGRLEIDIKVSAQVNFSALAARRKISRFVLSQISNLLHGGEPELVVAKRICWRVPIILSLPARGDIGSVGTIDVDVETGQILAGPEHIERIAKHAEDLASRAIS